MLASLLEIIALIDWRKQQDVFKGDLLELKQKTSSNLLERPGLSPIFLIENRYMKKSYIPFSLTFIDISLLQYHYAFTFLLTN